MASHLWIEQRHARSRRHRSDGRRGDHVRDWSTRTQSAVAVFVASLGTETPTVSLLVRASKRLNRTWTCRRALRSSCFGGPFVQELSQFTWGIISAIKNIACNQEFWVDDRRCRAVCSLLVVELSQFLDRHRCIAPHYAVLVKNYRKLVFL